MEDTLKKIATEILEEEGITAFYLDMVDLSIEFSPVIPIKGSKPMEAIKLQGGLYRVPECPVVGLNISEEQMKVMRCRFLINR